MAQPAFTAAELARPHEVEPRKTAPIKWWTGLCAAFLVIQLYIYGPWVTSSDFRPTAEGRDPCPDRIQASVTIIEILRVVGFVLAVYLLLYRRSRRDGRICLHGFLVPAYLTMYWQDLFCNIVKPAIHVQLAFLQSGFVVRISSPGWSCPTRTVCRSRSSSRSRVRGRLAGSVGRRKRL